MTADELRDEATRLLADLIRIDTSNPPGRETAAAAYLASYLEASGIACELVARDPDRANLVARLRGGSGPTLAFLGHLDVVPAERPGWSVDPFAGIVRDGHVWGRGAVDMKCQVVAAALAFRLLVADGWRPAGDLLLMVAADEEDGSAKIGMEWLVSERPDFRPDFAVGEGGGDRIELDGTPLYLFAAGEQGGSAATVSALGVPGDASVPRPDQNATVALARLLDRIAAHVAVPTVTPEVEALLDAVAPGDSSLAARSDEAKRVPLLARILDPMLRVTFAPTVVEVERRRNVIPDRAALNVQCSGPPGTTRAAIEAELRRTLGEGGYELDVTDPLGGTRSALGTPLEEAIAVAVAELDDGARIAPMLGLGFTDAHWLREAFDTVAYGFMPFRHQDPLVNWETKHGRDERVRQDDLVFQAEAAVRLARAFAWLT